MHAEQYIERLAGPGGNLDRLFWLDRQAIGRNDSQRHSICSRGRRAELHYRCDNFEQIAIDHGFLADHHEWRRFRQYRSSGGWCTLRILPGRNGKANGPAGFGLFFGDVPIGRKQHYGLLEISRNFSTMMRVHPHREGLSGDDLAAISGRIQSQSCDESQSRVYFFPFPLQTSRQGYDRCGDLVGNRGHRHFIDFSACGNQGTGGRLPIEPQHGIPCRHQGGIHGSHERVNTHIPGFIVFVQWAEWLCEQGRFELLAVFTLECDGAPQERRA